MLTFPLVFLAGCAGSSESADAETSALSTPPSGPDCDDAIGLAEQAAVDLDTHVALRATVFDAMENLVAMKALAARAATGTLPRVEREALQLEFAARLQEAQAFAATDPALDPTTLGVAGAHVDARVNAARSYVALDRAILTLGSHLATVDVEVGTLVRTAERVAAHAPDCELSSPEVDLPEVDTEAPVDAALAANATEGLAWVSDIRETTDTAHDILQELRILAFHSADETVSPNARAGIQAKFIALSAEIDALADTAEFEGAPYADGSRRVARAWFGPERGRMIEVILPDLRARTLGVDSGSLDLTTAWTSASAISAIDAATSTVESEQSWLDAAEVALTIEQERYTADPESE